MPIPAAEIASLKTSVNLAALARSRGIILKPVGRDLMGLCPFHFEKSPSFSITPAVNLFHCLGCGSGGSPIDLVMKLDNVDFLTAVRILSANHAPHLRVLSASHPGLPQMISNTEQKESPLLDPANQRVMRYAIQYYTKTLEGGAASARPYLQSRGLVHPELVSTFSIGYADGTLLSAIPSHNTQEGREIRASLLASGILRARDGRLVEHMKGRIVVPVMDEDGIIYQLYGRKLPVPGSTSPDHMYLPFSKNCVFYPRAFIAATLVVCEGPLDALSFFCAGMPNVSCTYSAADIPQAFLEAAEKGNVRRVLIAFDADPAGDRGAEKLAILLRERGIESARMQYPAHSVEGR